ncbi:MAG: UDP-2,3-diacylglucosamine diphosphatase LpxI [Planctomycetaceae bacterium]|nr:UDP-2,3-diacylglucosamine diphosphatase LpxI [Planctomycetaceae bacterium]
MVDASAKAPRRVGILAGWGRLPLDVAQSLRRQGCEVYCLGTIGHADPALAGLCNDFRWLGLAKFGAAIRYFRRRGVTEVTMVGKIFKVRLFERWRWIRNLPDLRTIRMFLPHFLTQQRDCRDDSLLMTVVEEFAAEGMQFMSINDCAPELLVREGQLTRRGPTARQQKDIAFGWKIAKQMGGLDIGQSVAVRDQAVLAVEAVEGTDECIRRAGALCRAGGFTVVKVAKPRQDMRFDVPTIGQGTLEMIRAAGGAVLAIEAHRTIILDQPAVVDYANRNGLVIVAVAGE